jgi:hypothetical protein
VLARQIAQFGDLALAEQRRGCGRAQVCDHGVANLKVEGLGEAHRLLQPRLGRTQVFTPGANRMDYQGGLDLRAPVDRTVLGM